MAGPGACLTIPSPTRRPSCSSSAKEILELSRIGLIWFVPEKQVFIDNRQDPYPSSFIRETTAVDAGAPYREMFDRFGRALARLPRDYSAAA